MAKAIVSRLLQIEDTAQGMTKTISGDELISLASTARGVFMTQSVFIELDAPVRICGDVHGQYADLLRLFDKGGFPPISNYLFLGDYVDRGTQNLEVIAMLFALKVIYPRNMFLLRGNHETRMINARYGFKDECIRRYNEKVYEAFQTAFDCLPISALVADRILCMHGGLSPQLKKLDQLRAIARPNNIVDLTLEMDLLWADPAIGLAGYKLGGRGAAHIFGEDVVDVACHDLGIDMVARAHQVVQDGYEFFANRKLVTIFSAPHYCGQFNNSAAMMLVNEHLQCSFEILRPVVGRNEVHNVMLAR